MENDESAVCFDTIVCQSGQFGFFQKRLFIINTLIQSACISVIVYTCTCMPEVDELENDGCGDASGSNFVVSNNGYHYNDVSSVSGGNSTHEASEHFITSSAYPSAINASLDFLLHNFTSILPTLATTTTSLGDAIGKFNLQENTTLDYLLDLVTNLTILTRSLSNSSLELLTDSATQPSTTPASTLDSFLEALLPKNNPSSTSASLDTYVPSVFEGFENLTSRLRENVTLYRSSTNGTTAALSFQDIQFNHNGATQKGDATDSLRKWTEGQRTDLDFVNTTPPATSPNLCNRPFILLRTDLRKTQILENMTTDDLVHITFYGQGISLIVGSCIGSMVADMFGRRRLLYISLAGMLTLHCLVALSISWIMFIFLRMLAVAFAGATMVVSSVIVIEFLGPDYRDACTCSCFWTIGAIVLSMETLVTLHWRWLAILSGGICLPLIGTYFTSMESVRWLQCQHRFTEAEAGFREVVSVNSSAVPDIMSLLDESRACIVHNMHQKKFTFLDLFHSLDSAKWTVALIYTCMVSACVYFCLLLRVKQITGLVHFDVFLPFILDLPLTWSVIVVNRCLGRRWCLFLYSVASGFALLSVLILHVTGNVAHMPSLVTGLALFGKIGVTASLSLIFLVAIETFPTVTRCMGLAVAISAASGGSMLSTALIFLEQYHYTVPFVVYGAMMASVGTVGLLFPETIRKPLKNVQQCRHRKIPLMEGARLVGRPPSLWDAV